MRKSNDAKKEKVREYSIKMTKAEIACVFAVLSAVVDKTLRSIEKNPDAYKRNKDSADAQLALMSLTESRLIKKLASLGGLDPEGMTDADREETDRGIEMALSLMLPGENGGNEA